MIHVRYESRSLDLENWDLNVNEKSRDNTIKQSLASYLDVALDSLADYVVDRRPSGDIVVRPQAVYG